MHKLFLETDQNKLEEQEARKNFIADLKTENINADFPCYSTENFSCWRCQHWDGQRCLAMTFKRKEKES